MTSPTMHKVFVYGSLLPGLQNNFFLETARQVSSGTIVGLLFSMGAFPALVTNTFLSEPTTDTVKGMLYEVNDFTLMDLDSLEGYLPGRAGNLYERELVPVTLPSGEIVEAYVYSGSLRILQSIIHDRLPHVPDGDWMLWAERYIIPHLAKDLAI